MIVTQMIGNPDFGGITNAPRDGIKDFPNTAQNGPGRHFGGSQMTGKKGENGPLGIAEKRSKGQRHGLCQHEANGIDIAKGTTLEKSLVKWFQPSVSFGYRQGQKNIKDGRRHVNESDVCQRCIVSLRHESGNAKDIRGTPQDTNHRPFNGMSRHFQQLPNTTGQTTQNKTPNIDMNEFLCHTGGRIVTPFQIQNNIVHVRPPKPNSRNVQEDIKECRQLNVLSGQKGIPRPDGLRTQGRTGINGTLQHAIRQSDEDGYQRVGGDGFGTNVLRNENETNIG
mmetsp:Transcript_23171/g.38331  ORF Transcript_23171/g.38331 Transcript_23171/m.38331 type:complete len:281 (-) Transcript_23171:461-1303(-)